MKVVKWLRKEGPVDAVCPIAARGGRSTTVALLHGAAASDQLEVVRELLKRGASVNLQTELGATALMDAAGRGHLSILRVLLQYSDPDLQANEGGTALMAAAGGGQEACVKALLRATRPTPSCSTTKASPPCGTPRLRAKRPQQSSSGST